MFYQNTLDVTPLIFWILGIDRFLPLYTDEYWVGGRMTIALITPGPYPTGGYKVKAVTMPKNAKRWVVDPGQLTMMYRLNAKNEGRLPGPADVTWQGKGGSNPPFLSNP